MIVVVVAFEKVIFNGAVKLRVAIVGAPEIVKANKLELASDALTMLNAFPPVANDLAPAVGATNERVDVSAFTVRLVAVVKSNGVPLLPVIVQTLDPIVKTLVLELDEEKNGTVTF